QANAQAHAGPSPGTSPTTRSPALAGDLSAAGVCARLRVGSAGRAAAAVHAGRVGPDPRRDRARLRSPASAAARSCRAGALRIRRAEPADADFLVELLTHDEVEPFLAAVRPKDRESVLAEIERSQREPADFGVFVIEVDGRPAGTMEFEVANRRSRIAHAG